MFQVRQYQLSVYAKEVLPQGRDYFWRLFRESSGNEARIDELFPSSSGSKNVEEGLTKANEFLCGRGQQIVGICPVWQGWSIFTEPVPDE
jgi:hypothetical protein